MAGSAARAGCRPPSLRVDVRSALCFSGQRGASDAEDEDEHPERLSAQVRRSSQILISLFHFLMLDLQATAVSMALPCHTH